MELSIIILSTYLHQYQGRLRALADPLSLRQATDEFMINYAHHVRGVSRNLDLIRRYGISHDHAFAKPLLREARFFYLLAYEDLHWLKYLARIHPNRRPFMERQVSILHAHLMSLDDFLHQTPQSSPPPRSA